MNSERIARRAAIRAANEIRLARQWRRIDLSLAARAHCNALAASGDYRNCRRNVSMRSAWYWADRIPGRGIGRDVAARLASQIVSGQ